MSKRKLDPTDISGLIDELDQSAFFRQPHPPELQSDKVPSNQATKDTKQASTIAPADQSTKIENNSPAKAPKIQSTQALKHFSSYLDPGTYKTWKLLATERERKDYEILQEAMEQYLAREQARE